MSTPPSHRHKSFSQGRRCSHRLPLQQRLLLDPDVRDATLVASPPVLLFLTLVSPPSSAAATKAAGLKTRPPLLLRFLVVKECLPLEHFLFLLRLRPPPMRLTPHLLMSEELSHPCYSTKLSFARVQPPGFDCIVLCADELRVYRFEPIEEAQAFWLLAHPSVADLTLYVRRRDHLVGQNPAVVLQLLEVAHPVLSRFLSDYPSTPLSSLLFQFIQQLFFVMRYAGFDLTRRFEIVLDVYPRCTEVPLPINFDVPLFPTVPPYFNFCVKTYQYSEVEHSAMAPFQDTTFLPTSRFLRDTNLVVSLDDTAVREQLIPGFRYAAGYLAGGGSTNEPIVATMFNSLQTNALAFRYRLAGEPDYAPETPAPITRNKGKGRATSHDHGPALHASQPCLTSVGREREFMSHILIASPPGFTKADYTAVRPSIPVAAKIPLIFGPPKSPRIASKISKSSTSRPGPGCAVAQIRSLRLRVSTPGPSNTRHSPVNDDGEDELDPADSPPRPPPRKTQGIMEQDGVSMPEPEDGFPRAFRIGCGDSSTKAVGVPLAPVAPRSYEDLVVVLRNGVVAATHDVDRAAAALASMRTTVEVLTSNLCVAAGNLSSTVRSMITYYGRSNFNWLWRIPDQYADVVFNFIAHETFQQANPDPEIRNFGLAAAQYFSALEFSSSDDASWMEFINSAPANPSNRVYQEPLFLGQLLGQPSEEVILKLAEYFKKVRADAGSSLGQK
ncbi:hypothetical protein K438DRAFT_1984081 [Mycena galopus ATCC 62051]|nr:hypothetical protein K438DRAFT_1984081 [Mycena galopus ATCC 62051]